MNRKYLGTDTVGYIYRGMNAVLGPFKSVKEISQFDGDTSPLPEITLTIYYEDAGEQKLADLVVVPTFFDSENRELFRITVTAAQSAALADPNAPTLDGKKFYYELSGNDWLLAGGELVLENSVKVAPAGSSAAVPVPYVKSAELSSAILTDGVFRPNAPIRIGNTLLASASMTLGGNHTALIEVDGFTVSEGYKYAHLEIRGRFECNIPLHVSSAGEITDTGTHVLGGISAPDYIKIGSINGNIAVEIGHTNGFGGNLSFRLIGSGEISQYQLITTVNGSLPSGEALTLRTKLPGQLYVEKEAFHATSSSWTIISDKKTKEVVARLTYDSMLAFVSTFEETPIWIRNGKLGTRQGDYGYSQIAQTYENAINNLVAALPEEERANIPDDFAEKIGAIVRTPIWVDDDLNEVDADAAGAKIHYRLSANLDFGYMVFAGFASVSALRAKAAKAALAEALAVATTDAEKFAAIEAWAAS